MVQTGDPPAGAGYEERPGTELGAGLFRAGAGAGAAPARRKVVPWKVGGGACWSQGGWREKDEKGGCQTS